MQKYFLKKMFHTPRQASSNIVFITIPSMNAILTALLTALAYLGVVIWIRQLHWGAYATSKQMPDQTYSLIPTKSIRHAEWWGTQCLLMLALVLHGSIVLDYTSQAGFMRFGFAYALSIMWFLTLAVYGMIRWIYPRAVEEHLFLSLPLGALFVLLPLWFGGRTLIVASSSLVFHIILSMLTSALFMIGMIQAGIIFFQEKYLHDPHHLVAKFSFLSTLPPIITMEEWLYKILAVGFVLLSITLISGGWFSEEIFGRPWLWEHKTIFGLLSWLVFMVIVGGHFVYGWRGRTILRATWTGISFLLLSYIGSYFVLEVILRRFQ